MADDVAILRSILQRELETINAYEEMLGRLSDPRLREIVEHVTDEEREHVAEMYELIMAHDPRQRERSGSAGAHVQRAGQGGAGGQGGGGVQGGGGDGTSAAEVAGAPPLAGDPVPPPGPVFPSEAFSVGSLKKGR